MNIKSHRSMVVLQSPAARQVSTRRIYRASALMRPLPFKVQARLEKPKVFCDPRMPGGWAELDQILVGSSHAA